MPKIKTIADLQALIERRNKANEDAHGRSSGPVFLSAVLDLLDDLDAGGPVSSSATHTQNFCGAAELILVRGFRFSMLPAGEAILAEARSSSAYQRRAA